MTEKTARGPIKIRNENGEWFVEYGSRTQGPLIAVQVADEVKKLLKRDPDAVVMGPTHTLGRDQTADPYSKAPFAVKDMRGHDVATGYSVESLLDQNIGRLLGWKRGSAEGVPMRQRRTWEKEAARMPSGLYGYTKKTQADCEVAIRRINKQAVSLVRAAYRKDERVLQFLETHAKRAASNPARVLLAAWKTAEKTAGLEGGKVAAGRSYSLYGYPTRTVKAGLALCSALRETTGSVAAALHARQAARYAHITGFFQEHSKQARCYTSRMLLAGYPDENARYATDLNKTANLDGVGEGMVGDWFTRGGEDEEDPEHTADCGCDHKMASVDDWLSWDLDELDNVKMAAKKYKTKLEALEAAVASLKEQIKEQKHKIRELSDIASSLGPKAIDVWLRKDKEFLSDRERLLKEVEQELADEKKKG